MEKTNKRNRKKQMQESLIFAFSCVRQNVFIENTFRKRHTVSNCYDFRFEMNTTFYYFV